ncbi:MAG: DoxX family membrane protein [Bacteroidia bacterium]|nr:DoxX family membrane protein [Bacteroidia bacterium]
MNSLFNPESVALLFARTLLAVLFIFQGYDKLFRIGPEEVAKSLYPSFQKFGISRSLFQTGIWLNAFIEFACGLFLLMGLLKYVSLSLLGLNMLLVSAAMSLVNPVWDMKLIFPRFLLLLFILLFPDEYDVLSLSYFLKSL